MYGWMDKGVLFILSCMDMRRWLVGYLVEWFSVGMKEIRLHLDWGRQAFFDQIGRGMRYTVCWFCVGRRRGERVNGYGVGVGGIDDVLYE